MKMPDKAKNKQPSFIPKERGSLPRILLLDFGEETQEHLQEKNYNVSWGSSGFAEVPMLLPSHQSEVEIIFWDTSKLRVDDNLVTTSGVLPIGNQYCQKMYEGYIRILRSYFSRVRAKGGFVGILLGNHTDGSVLPRLSDLLGYNFDFTHRDTSTIDLSGSEDADPWIGFYSRFIKQENILHAINWHDNLVSFRRYFEDEDNNVFAVSYDYFAIIPKIEEGGKKDALVYLLQDVLPFFCSGAEIFPEKYYYRWANKEIYLPSKVQVLKKNEKQLTKEFRERLQEINEGTKEELDGSEYLSNLLISDDSDLFTDDKKLSTSVHKVLESDLGFSVTDVDEMRLKIGESLKEDKWLEDEDGFFALVEIKGTDRGAKANWVRQDLNAHLREFEAVKDIQRLNSMLIFNHERREEPEKRTPPFLGDKDLLDYCEKTKINLVPVYELFKLANDIKDKKISEVEAQTLIKQNVGLFNYQRK